MKYLKRQSKMAFVLLNSILAEKESEKNTLEVIMNFFSRPLSHKKLIMPFLNYFGPCYLFFVDCVCGFS